ncbi:hypothetical protein BC332_24268 [Capsicum chinense]|nr:hypothetical protein BC332_24268 [Capsicum chinense]
MNGNELQGKILRSLANCKELEVVDLGDNHLNDTFPMWMGTLSMLQVLSVRSKKFHGDLIALRVLNLSHNGLQGHIPPSLENLAVEESFDLSFKGGNGVVQCGIFMLFLSCYQMLKLENVLDTSDLTGVKNRRKKREENSSKNVQRLILEKNKNSTRTCKVFCNADVEFDIGEGKYRHTVDLTNRLNFRELLKMHKPTLVVLLETCRDNHQSMPSKFHLSNIVAVPAKGKEGGIAILWYADHLNVTNMALTHQEVHCMVQVSNDSLAMESISTSIQMLGNRLIRLSEI